MRFSHRDNVFLHEHFRVLHRRLREVRLPEPCFLDREAGQCRKSIAFLVNVLTCTLFVGLDVGVEQCVGRVFGGIQVHHKALGLDGFYQCVDFFERNLVV